MSGTFNRIYGIVKMIPFGKVATYGQIAKTVNSQGMGLSKGITPRVVGWALYAICSLKVPCHRVVNKDGSIADNFGAFLPSKNHPSRRERIVLKSREGRLGGGGWREQKRRLLAEGVAFKDQKHIDPSFFWQTS